MRALKYGIAVAAVTALGFAGSASANVLGNPGFEVPDASGGDLVGWGAPWFNFGAPTAFTTATAAHTGSQSAKMFGPFDGIGGGVGGGQTHPAAPGQTWVAEAWALNSSADPIGAGNFLALKIEFLDAGFGLAAGGLAGVDIFEITFDEFSATDVWTKLGVGTAPAPAGTAFANYILVHVQGGVEPVTGGAVFVDDAFFIPAPGMAAFFGLGGLAMARRRRR